MDDRKLGRLLRALRLRRGWRQVDLAQRAGLGRSVISDLELGRLEGVGVASVRRITAVFGLSFEGSVWGLGADLDRLLDERHASIMAAAITWLKLLGWQTRAEVSYSEWGERGSVDILAWHASSGCLLVIEVKSELASIEATLRKHDEKVRLAPTIATSLGWPASSVGRLLILPEGRTERRRVARFASIIDGAYPLRTRQVRAWCRAPSGSISGLLFLAVSAPRRTQVGRRTGVAAPADRTVGSEHGGRPGTGVR